MCLTFPVTLVNLCASAQSRLSVGLPLLPAVARALFSYYLAHSVHISSHAVSGFSFIWEVHILLLTCVPKANPEAYKCKKKKKKYLLKMCMSQIMGQSFSMPAMNISVFTAGALFSQGI